MLIALTLLGALNFAGILGEPLPLVCYWESWARYRINGMAYGVDKIPLDLCTHVVYSFAGIDPATHRIKSLDPDFDFNQDGFKQLVALKQKKPSLKVTVAVGGWNEGAQKFSAMAETADRRKAFVDSVVDWVKQYNFDGIDLDWEYPGSGERGGRAIDKKNFPNLLKELRAALNGMGGGKRLITVAVGVARSKLNDGYDLPAIAPHIDYIHMMSYDMRGSWDGFTDHQAPLYKRSFDQGAFAELNVADVMKMWESAGMPKSKLILGVPLYGRSYALQNPSNNGMKAPISGAGSPGPYTQQEGYLAYFELCEKIGSYQRKWDDVGKVPYMFSGNQWISYDDPESIAHKMALVRKENYGGAMVWAVDLDDYMGKCGSGKNPLLAAIRAGLDGGNPAPNPTPTQKPTPTQRPTPTQNPTNKPTPSPPQPDNTCNGSNDGTMYRLLPDCGSFYQCANGIPWKKQCPAGLIFDPASRACNWRSADNSQGCE